MIEWNPHFFIANRHVWLALSAIWFELLLFSSVLLIDSHAISDDKRIDLAEFKQAVSLLVSARMLILASMHDSLTGPAAAFRMGGAFRLLMRKPRLRRSIGMTAAQVLN